MKPAASAWLYTSSSSNVTKSSLYKEYGEVAPAEIMLPLYNLSFTSPVTVFEFHQRMLCKAFINGAEPHAIVCKFSVFVSNEFFVVVCSSVEAKVFKFSVSIHNDGSTWVFINTTGFHAYQSIFNDIPQRLHHSVQLISLSFSNNCKGVPSWPSTATGTPSLKDTVT